MNLPSSNICSCHWARGNHLGLKRGLVSLAYLMRRDHFGWFFVVDDDLYMNRENANLALSAFDPSSEIALGWRERKRFFFKWDYHVFVHRQVTSIQIVIVNANCFM